MKKILILLIWMCLLHISFCQEQVYVSYSGENFKGITDITDVRLKKAETLTLFVYSEKKCKLPDQLPYLENVRTLLIQGDSLTRLSESIDHFSNLRALHIDCYAFELLPDAIGRLKKLEYLDIDSRSKEKFTLPNTIGDLSNLTRLEISHEGLSELPNSFQHLLGLKQLKIDKSKLTEFPQVIIALDSGINEVKIDASLFTSLPDNFSSLKCSDWDSQTVGQLFFYNFKELKSLPPEFRNLNFDVFILGAEHLTDVSSLNSSNKVFKLHIGGIHSRKQLRKLLKSIKGGDNLILTFNYNSRLMFPRAIFKLRGLKELNVNKGEKRISERSRKRLEKKLPTTKVIIY